jgi:hypothetical protein
LVVLPSSGNTNQTTSRQSGGRYRESERCCCVSSLAQLSRQFFRVSPVPKSPVRTQVSTDSTDTDMYTSREVRQSVVRSASAGSSPPSGTQVSTGTQARTRKVRQSVHQSYAAQVRDPSPSSKILVVRDSSSTTGTSPEDLTPTRI